MSLARRLLRSLADATADEGTRLAERVRAGELTRAEVEAAHEQHPGDAEPVIALELLDRWGIR